MPSGIKEVKGYILDLDTSLVVECFPDMTFVSKLYYAVIIFKVFVRNSTNQG